MPDICHLCNITEADQEFDSDMIFEKMQALADKKDHMFLQKFAYTQMFSFLLENYVAAIN